MRALHVVHTLDPAGAGAVEAARLYAGVSDAGYSTEVLSLDQDAAPFRASWPVPTHSVGQTYTAYRYAPGLVPWLRSNSARFDAVIVHGIWHYHLVGVSRALHGGAVPYFVILHGMLNPWFKRTYPLKHLKKSLFWHGAVRAALRHAAAVLFLCEEEHRLARLTFPLDQMTKVFTGLGTKIQQHSAELLIERHPECRSRRLLVFLGRICHTKGCDLLMEAFARVAGDHPSAHLLLCGPDEERCQSGLMRLASKLGIANRITWPGPLYGELKWAALAAADLFVLPSRCEAFPITVLEALGCGKAVLITEDVNIHPTIGNSGAGLVCKTTVASISAALDQWLAMSSDMRQAFGIRARECFAKNYTLDRAARAHVAAIRPPLTPFTPFNEACALPPGLES
jgi:glycosyltransferase involved in cell wall biosynthesis